MKRAVFLSRDGKSHLVSGSLGRSFDLDGAVQSGAKIDTECACHVGGGVFVLVDGISQNDPDHGVAAEDDDLSANEPGDSRASDGSASGSRTRESVHRGSIVVELRDGELLEIEPPPKEPTRTEPGERRVWRTDMWTTENQRVTVEHTEAYPFPRTGGVEVQKESDS